MRGKGAQRVAARERATRIYGEDSLIARARVRVRESSSLNQCRAE